MIPAETESTLFKLRHVSGEQRTNLNLGKFWRHSTFLHAVRGGTSQASLLVHRVLKIELHFSLSDMKQGNDAFLVQFFTKKKSVMEGGNIVSTMVEKVYSSRLYPRPDSESTDAVHTCRDNCVV